MDVFDSANYEKTSYVAIISEKYVIGDDYNVGNRCDSVNALLSDFMKKIEKDVKDCVEEDVVEVVLLIDFMVTVLFCISLINFVSCHGLSSG